MNPFTMAVIVVAACEQALGSCFNIRGISLQMTLATRRSLPPHQYPLPRCQKGRNHRNGRDAVLDQESVEKLYALASGCPPFNGVHSLNLFTDKPKMYDTVTPPNYMKSTIASKSQLYHVIQ